MCAKRNSSKQNLKSVTDFVFHGQAIWGFLILIFNYDSNWTTRKHLRKGHLCILNFIRKRFLHSTIGNARRKMALSRKLWPNLTTEKMLLNLGILVKKNYDFFSQIFESTYYKISFFIVIEQNDKKRDLQNGRKKQLIQKIQLPCNRERHFN